MLRNILSICRRLASPIYIFTVIFLLVNCYLLTLPDRVISRNKKVVRQVFTEDKQRNSHSGVRVVPIEQHGGRESNHLNQKQLDDDFTEIKIVKSNQVTTEPKQNLTHVKKLDDLSKLQKSNTNQQENNINEPGKIPSINSEQNLPKSAYEVIRKTYVIPDIQYTNLANCDKLMSNDTEEIVKARELMDMNPKVPLYEEYYLEWTKNCQRFKDVRGYIQIPLTEEEENYPLAFSISMFTDAEQAERLLRTIYQPQNLYCIHIDTKSPLLLHTTMQAIAGCFDNVFIASTLHKVKWGDWSVLQPALSCMKDLLRLYWGKWKYFINLTGQEFPLRTNYELVRIAKIYNGSNEITGSKYAMDMERVSYLWTHRWSKTYQQTIFYNTMIYRPPPPYNITFYKGEVHGLFTPKFVEYIVESELAQKFLEWCIQSGHASEHFWNTLNYNQHLNAPGGYEGNDVQAHEYFSEPVIRAKHWAHYNYVPRVCRGQIVRGICIYGVGDLTWLATRRELFANKFYLTYEYLAYDCLEERHRKRTKLRSTVNDFFSEEYYEKLPTVLYSRKNGLL